MTSSPTLLPDNILPATGGRKLFAGARIRRIRAARGLTQTRMASDLGVSVSYLNLIERDQRPLSASFLLKLAGSYDLDLKSLTGNDGADLADELVRVFTDPRLTGIDVPRTELRELAARSPGIAQALIRLHASTPSAATAPRTGPLESVVAMIEAAGNHFPALDAASEALADELRMSGPDLNAAVVERLRARHAITVRAMPVDVLPDALRRLDLHARQLQLSESLDAASRGFAAAIQLVLIELKTVIAETIAGAGITDPLAARAATIALAKYAAGAVLMPYARFLAACEATGYDVELLQARFGRGLEQVAHRLSTLARPGARGIPFFFLRTDRASTISKSFAPGPSPIPIIGGCALWSLHAAFDRPGEVRRQLVELEDGHRFLTLSRTVKGTAAPWGAPRAEFAIGIGCDVRHAAALAWSAGLELNGPATPIGPGCTACHRAACRQRSLPPAAAHLAFDERQRGLTPFRFTED
ncbi:transcriptional regulator [Polymorphobacter glacialis]|uniref:Transcriptional regulator n=1 Tax=Sandarakinorhabdus glacialis TaxID=1614636 RepID=A0A916ZQ69_9SPHN|nr:short-chain fatty acyl-CoA regulator family protein [Polymorphobacter glacialis]GGE08853.1 transcriptional regulator [Polymorphobacter glacialis]